MKHILIKIIQFQSRKKKIYLQVGKHNDEMDKIIRVLSEIKTNGQSTKLKESLDVFRLLPSIFTL